MKTTDKKVKAVPDGLQKEERQVSTSSPREQGRESFPILDQQQHQPGRFNENKAEDEDRAAQTGISPHQLYGDRGFGRTQQYDEGNYGQNQRAQPQDKAGGHTPPSGGGAYGQNRGPIEKPGLDEGAKKGSGTKQ